jgi:hypothetical protein
MKRLYILTKRNETSDVFVTLGALDFGSCDVGIENVNASGHHGFYEVNENDLCLADI